MYTTLTKFINDYVTCRSQSMFLDDINAPSFNAELKSKIQNRKVLVIGGADSIGSSFIRALMPFRLNCALLSTHIFQQFKVYHAACFARSTIWND